MFLIAALLAIAAAVFSAASVNSAGWAAQVCRYGDVFCMNPTWLVVAAILAAIWACLMRVDRL
ncbi:hypothetical protein [Rhodopseudomonas sp. P2A-2r]|uniref:hypothetical protein n=1 Tax=unclassified Rhodopseudomonas TaxID=2638247 RepID=UPI002234CF2B|nr:hypothetical protein [Rhodopseudomonas sp. P2A-2r]UZE47022.1 hypothetical protein ONR75_18640 [Rhodopseudomonas sp. P2A-2r]